MSRRRTSPPKTSEGLPRGVRCAASAARAASPAAARAACAWPAGGLGVDSSEGVLRSILSAAFASSDRCPRGRARARQPCKLARGRLVRPSSGRRQACDNGYTRPRGRCDGDRPSAPDADVAAVGRGNREPRLHRRRRGRAQARHARCPRGGARGGDRSPHLPQHPLRVAARDAVVLARATLGALLPVPLGARPVCAGRP